MLENLGIPSLAALVWSVIVAVVTVRSIRVAYAAWKTPADTAAQPAGKRAYASYEEWRRDALNCEVPSDEVAARTPEGFFGKHPKLAPPEKPEPQPNDFATPQYGPASGANVAYPPEAVAHGGLDISSVVIRIQPPNGIVGIHNRFFRPDELRATYGPGRYIIRVRYLNLDQESVINWEVS